MVESTFEETSTEEFWLTIFEKGGEPAALEKLKELRQAGRCKTKQEAAFVKASQRFEQLAPGRREAREIETLKVSRETRELQKTGNHIQWGVFAVLLLTLLVTCKGP